MDGNGPIYGVTICILVLLFGAGWMISRDQDNSQARAIACIEAGFQFVKGSCVSGPAP